MRLTTLRRLNTFHNIHNNTPDQGAPMEVDSNDPIKISFEVPSQLEESSIEDDTPRQHDNDNTPTVATYERINDGSQKGKEKLADSEGYTYTIKARMANGNKVWTCSVRSKSM